MMGSPRVLARSCKCEDDPIRQWDGRWRREYTQGYCTGADVNDSDAEDTQYVYAWRLEQEAALRKAKGTGMTDEQVLNFVNGCEFLLAALLLDYLRALDLFSSSRLSLPLPLFLLSLSLHALHMVSW